MKILHLTLKRQWFDLIATGKKDVEYREYKPYWTKRLYHREYDLIHFRNGYRKDSPFMIVECKGIDLVDVDGYWSYYIWLGKVLEIKNWDGVKND